MFDYTLPEIVKTLKSEYTPVENTHVIPIELLNLILQETVTQGTAGGYDNLPVFTYIKDEQIKVVKGGFTIRFPINEELVSLGLTPNLMNYANIKFERYNCLELLHKVNTVGEIVAFLKGKGIISYASEIKETLIRLLTEHECFALGCVDFKIFGSTKPTLEIKTYTGWVQTVRVQVTRSFIEEIILLDKELAD